MAAIFSAIFIVATPATTHDYSIRQGIGILTMWLKRPAAESLHNEPAMPPTTAASTAGCTPPNYLYARVTTP